MNLLQKIAEFNRKVVKLPEPEGPQPLSPVRKHWTVEALKEEVEEFAEAEDWYGEIDALVDLVYFAIGRFDEMGLDFYRFFDIVHNCNMKKHRGSRAKRGNNPDDAVKPEDWIPPEAFYPNEIERQLEQVHCKKGGHRFLLEKVNAKGYPVCDVCGMVFRDPKDILIAARYWDKDAHNTRHLLAREG